MCKRITACLFAMLLVTSIGLAQTDWCDLPPWSGDECEGEWVCGTIPMLNLMSNWNQDVGLSIVVHSPAGVDLRWRWAFNNFFPDIYMPVEFTMEPGDYRSETNDLLELLWPEAPPVYGAILLDYRTCDGYAYIDYWEHTQGICNPDRAEHHATKLEPGCYELPGLVNGFIRGQFWNPSATEWAAITIDGVEVLVPPGEDDYFPEVKGYNFHSNWGLHEVCLGIEPPWSGDPRVNYDLDLWVSFEQQYSGGVGRITLLPRPLP